MIRLLKLIAPFRWWIVAGVLLSFAVTGASVGLMAVSAYLISKAALARDMTDLAVWITGVRFFAVSRAALRYAERYVTHLATFRILTSLRVWFYSAVEPLAPARLASYRSGDLLTRIVADIETLENFYLRVVIPPLAAALVTLLACLLLGSFDVWLGIALLSFLLLTGVALPLASRWLSRQPAAEAIALRAELNATLVDDIQGIADLLACGQEEVYQARTLRLSQQLHQAQQRLAQVRGLGNGLAALCASLAALTVLFLAIPLVTAGQIDGVFLALLPLAAIAAFEAVQPLAHAWQTLESSQAAARRIFELVDAPGLSGRRIDGGTSMGATGQPHTSAADLTVLDVVDGGTSMGATVQPPTSAADLTVLDVVDAPGLSGRRVDGGMSMGATGQPHTSAADLTVLDSGGLSIEIRDLRFRYAADEPLVLDGVSFSVPAGGRAAIVGPNGSGKSSLVNLLLRFWDYEGGTIRVGGRDLREMSADEARGLLAVVPQHTHLFNATIRDNLHLANPDASDDELIAACQQAQLHDFIQSLPQGYDTLVGENGLLLSGGERQRLAIARAVLKDAPILILDEATSQLDALTEQRLLQSLAAFMGRRTTLLISHRRAGLAQFERIELEASSAGNYT
ncbi:MAG: ATP-binding cassette domain-containing protein [Anaerolineae bacterium]